MLKTNRYLAPLLILAILCNACGGNFASQLRTVLTLAPPLIQSLVDSGVIEPGKKQLYLQDFSDLADAAATLKTDLDASPTKLEKLNAVSRFEVRFWDVLRRGRFKTSEKLQRIETILRAIIATAKIYYGGSSGTRDRSSVIVTEQTIKDQIAELKQAMK